MTARTPLARLLAFVATDTATDCWNWTGATRSRQGYGSFTLNGRTVQAHRASYELHVGPIGNGLVLDHVCRNRRCVNPAHLEPVTNAENIRRGQGIAPRNAAKTHCHRGHEFTAENTIHQKTGRACRECARAATRAYMSRRRSSRPAPAGGKNNSKEQAA